jgi:hypothetical protein
MYVEKKMMVVVLAVSVVVLAALVWVIIALQSATAAAEQAGTRADEATKKCQPCSAMLTRTTLEQTLTPLRADVGALLAEARGTRDTMIAIQAKLPDLGPLAQFLRFSSAYHELLLENLARKDRVDLAQVRAEVEKMFESQGGKPPGWFWGPIAPNP